MPEIRPGFTVRVHQKVIDILTDPKTGKVTGKKERAQVFEGVVIAKKGGHGTNSTFTVRKISYGVGVERIFPLHSPNIVKLEVEQPGREYNISEQPVYCRLADEIES
jgi:large subunit ribosomal protein L19